MKDPKMIKGMFFNEDVAWDNVYDSEFNDISVIELVNKCEYLVPFPCDPWNITQDDLKEMLGHYEDREEYEKCINIYNAIKSGVYES
jgi:hypothetical protein|tara:strand:+ start:541 stop:801 length:261 start_codon:yes stop_codon:yes gene_type:complete